MELSLKECPGFWELEEDILCKDLKLCYPHLQVDGGVGLVGGDLVVDDRQSLPSLVQLQTLCHVDLGH